MSAARTHVLDHALHLHYGTSPGDDLSYRVLMRWKAGEIGEALPITRRVTAPLWLAAAGVALLASLGMWLAKPPQPPVLVALEQPVRVLRGSSWSEGSAHFYIEYRGAIVAGPTVSLMMGFYEELLHTHTRA